MNKLKTFRARIGFILLFLVSLLITGCLVPSLHSLYTDKDAVFVPGLVGKWVDEDEHSWTFKKKDEKSYLLSYREDTETPQRFSVHLVQINNAIYMDLFPDEVDDLFVTKAEMMKAHMLGIHTFSKIQLSGDYLVISMLSPEWINQKSKDDQLHVSNEETSDGVRVLTAKPEELQNFIKVYGDDLEMFSKPQWELKRAHGKNEDILTESTATSGFSTNTAVVSMSVASTTTMSAPVTAIFDSGRGSSGTRSTLYMLPLSNEVAPGNRFHLNVVFDNPQQKEVDEIGMLIRYNRKSLVLHNTLEGFPLELNKDIFGGWTIESVYHNPSKGELYFQLKSPGNGKIISGELGTVCFEMKGKVFISHVQFRFNSWGTFPNTFVTYQKRDILGKENDHNDGTISTVIHVSRESDN